MTRSAPPSSPRLADARRAWRSRSRASSSTVNTRAQPARVESAPARASRDGVAADERDLARRAALQLAARSPAAISGGAAQHEDTPAGRACPAARAHPPASQQPQAPCQVRAQHPVRVHARALRAKRSSSGYIAASIVASQAGVLGQVHAPAAAGHQLVELVQRCGAAPARPPGRSSGERPARQRERQRAPAAGPKRLNTARYTGHRRARSSSTQRSQPPPPAGGQDELVLDHPGRAVQPAPRAERRPAERSRAPARAGARARCGAPYASAAR